MNGDIFAGTSEDGVFRSTDNCENWTQINNGLPFDDSSGTWSNIYALSFNSDGTIFIVSSEDLYRSTDNGDSWTETNSGLSNLYVTSIDINSSGYIYAGTYGGGVFRSINSTVSVEQENILPSIYFLNQNYPNPFNPNTIINYSIPNQSYVTLKVFDVLGREIETLVNEEQAAGIYEIDWNAENNSSGVYFYRISTGSFSDTKKMLLIR